MANLYSVTIQNLEAAFVGESMTHIKYRYSAKLAREAGADDVAKIFEETAVKRRCKPRAAHCRTRSWYLRSAHNRFA